MHSFCIYVHTKHYIFILHTYKMYVYILRIHTSSIPCGHQTASLKTIVLLWSKEVYMWLSLHREHWFVVQGLNIHCTKAFFLLHSLSCQKYMLSSTQDWLPQVWSSGKHPTSKGLSLGTASCCEHFSGNLWGPQLPISSLYANSSWMRIRKVCKPNCWLRAH